MQMSTIKYEGEKYDVRDRLCIGRPCLQLGLYQHRGATMLGGRNIRARIACCLHRAYHGCPDQNFEYDAAMARQRKDEGCKIL